MTSTKPGYKSHTLYPLCCLTKKSLVGRQTRGAFLHPMRLSILAYWYECPEDYMNTYQIVEGSTARTSEFQVPSVDRRAVSPRVVLEELFELLEDYAPTWYTEEHHNRAVAALLGRES